MEEWKAKAFQAAVVLLAVAIVVHVIWALLTPVVPVLLAIVALAVIYRVMFGRRH